MDHMEKLGGYAQFDFDKVREGGKNPNRFSGNGKRKHVDLLPESDSKIKVNETPKRRKKAERILRGAMAEARRGRQQLAN